MAHEVLVHEDRVKEYLSSLDDEDEECKHTRKLSHLAENPYPGEGRGDKKQIKGRDEPNNLFRIRSGDHRGLYQILDQDKEVLVWDFDRKERFERRYNID